MTAASPWLEVAGVLSATLRPSVAPTAITFAAAAGAPPFEDASAAMPEPTPDGRNPA